MAQMAVAIVNDAAVPSLRRLCWAVKKGSETAEIVGKRYFWLLCHFRSFYYC